jgi:hypothetical protein
MEKYEELLKLNLNGKTEKKGNLTYLSWAWAWQEFKRAYPNATYEVVKFENGLPYTYDEKTGYMCFTKVTVGDLTHEMWLPVMDYKNKAIKGDNADMFDVNKTIMRCLTKNLAMFGLGLYIYAGEDLPEPQTNSHTPMDYSGNKTTDTWVKNAIVKIQASADINALNNDWDKFEEAARVKGATQNQIDIMEDAKNARLSQLLDGKQ